MEHNSNIVKCFETPMKNYFYDRYLNSVVQVTKEEYYNLQKVEKEVFEPQVFPALKKYIDTGFLHKSRVKQINHPATPILSYLSEKCVEHLILQVTQQCNLRCEYCAYSGKYNNREHSNKTMSLETARQAIDFYMKRNSETKEFSISFYGGEPLLEFEIIKESVEYCKSYLDDKSMRYGMTTNATLLYSDEIVEFLIRNQFHIMISIDGPEREHDINRKFINGNGSFKMVMKNLKKIKKLNPDYYKNNISFNCVISNKSDVGEIFDFFSDRKFFYPGKVTINTVSPDGIKDKTLIPSGEKFEYPYKYELLKLYLSMLERIPENEAVLLYAVKGEMERLYNNLHEHSQEQCEMHHDGPCIPGVRRVFVTTDGKLYPCERVSESGNEMLIGSLETGYDCSKMDFIINFGVLTEKECLECWNLRQCRFCFGQVNDKTEAVHEHILEHCFISKQNTLYNLEKLCILLELGYQPKEAILDEANSAISIQ